MSPTTFQFRFKEANKMKIRIEDTCEIINNEDCSSNSSDDDFTPPNAELCAKIVEQVEFYFSDVNIMKDTFLLQHMKHNKEGYISLKLLSGFKRIKHLVKNWRELCHAFRNGSELLQLNTEGTKIRRIKPLPSYDTTSPSRTIIAFNLPLEKPITIKNVANLFAPCGRIVLVRVLLPKNPIPNDIKPYISSIPQLQYEACALVEFSDIEGVQCALKKRPAFAQAAPLLWGGMRVLSLTPQQMTHLDVNFSRSSPRRSSFHYNNDLTPLSSPMLIRNNNNYNTNRRHSCPSIQQSYTPKTRRRSNAALPENVIRLPRGPDGTRGFRDRSDLSSSD